MAGMDLEVLNDFNDAFKEQIVSNDEGENEEAVERISKKHAAGDEIDGADEELPDTATGCVGFEGEDEMGDGTKDHRPGEDDCDTDAGKKRNENRKDAGQNQQEAQRD